MQQTHAGTQQLLASTDGALSHRQGPQSSHTDCEARGREGRTLTLFVPVPDKKITRSANMLKRGYALAAACLAAAVAVTAFTPNGKSSREPKNDVLAPNRNAMTTPSAADRTLV